MEIIHVLKNGRSVSSIAGKEVTVPADLFRNITKESDKEGSTSDGQNDPAQK